MKDECAICGRVLSLYSLRRCPRCKKLHCRSCMTTNLWSEQRDLICLNCARRIVSPRGPTSKYGPLREYLLRRGKFTILTTLTFSKIEGVINGNLPFGALRSDQWWNNDENTAQGYAWRSAGWEVQSVDLKERAVTFKKLVAEGHAPVPRSKRGRTGKAQKPFKPVPVRPRRIRKPSKTRVAKAIARARNVERRRAAMQLGQRSKPKSAYEKRMYKPEAKPTRQD